MTPQFSAMWTRRLARFCVIALLMLSLPACHRQAAQQRAYDQHATSPAHQEWARRLQGNWQRVDGQNDTYEATGAPQLTIDDKNIHHRWSDGQTLDTRWAAVQADKDVVHAAVQMPNRSAEIWRLYLYTPQELVVFAPGLPPATYRRGGTETAELSTQMQQHEDASASGARSAQAQMEDEARELLGLTADDAPSKAEAPVATMPPPAPSQPPNADASPEVSTPSLSGTASPALPASASRGKPSTAELQAIYQRIQSVHHAMTAEDRTLGERLLRGTWDLTPESLEQINAHAAENGVELEGAVLKFGEQERLSMIWKTADETLSNGAMWSIEGMYGTELRVILTEPHQQPNRERLQFLDVDHFVLDPGGEHMIFERRAN